MEKIRYNISVAGAGYVGLTQAVFFSRSHNVVLIEPNKDRVDSINNRISPLKDDKLQEILNGDINLVATTDKGMYKDADYVIVAVPTNYDESKNYFDCSIVDSVIEDVRKVNKDAYIVIKSTVPIGYVKSVKERFDVNRVMMSPEFLREGRAMFDLLNPSRIVVGCDVEDVDAAFVFAHILNIGADKRTQKITVMRTSEAESVKLFANTYLAMRVAYLNELDTFAELNGLDSKSIIKGVVGDDRIGEGYCNPSFGYGGYCFPKDTKQLAANCKDIPQKIISAIVDSNKIRKHHIVNQILLKKPNTVGVYKLAMKSGSDNARSSAILDIIDELKLNNVKVNIYDPDNGYNISIGELKECDLIITNRYDSILDDVKDKVYTRDCFNTD